MKTLSFIVPAYNSQAYLRRCLDSFLTEADTFRNLEVIIINDGSTDRTVEIAREYTEDFPQVYRLFNKENGGHGSAINIGSRLACGNYMKVIDADDWVVTKNLPPFVRLLSQCQADVVLTPFHQINLNTGKQEIWKMHCSDYTHVVSLKDILENWRVYDKCMTFHGITYRTDFYNRHRHELPEKIFYEDQEYAAIPCCKAKSFQPVDLFLYQYSVGSAAQSVSMQNRLARLSHIEEVTKNLLCYRNQCRKSETTQKEYLFKKIEIVALSHYVVTLLAEKNRARGRNAARCYQAMLKKTAPEIGQRLQKKYTLYCLLNRIRMPYAVYQKLLHSALYSILRGSYKVEIEAVHSET